MKVGENTAGSCAICGKELKLGEPKYIHRTQPRIMCYRRKELVEQNWDEEHEASYGNGALWIAMTHPGEWSDAEYGGPIRLPPYE